MHRSIVTGELVTGKKGLSFASIYSVMMQVTSQIL